MKKHTLLIDMTFFIEGHSIGLNSYLLALLDGFDKLSDDLDVQVYVASSYVDDLGGKYPSISFVGLPFLQFALFRFLYHHFLFFFLQGPGKVFLFPSNFIPMLAPSRSAVVIHDLNYLVNSSSFSPIQELYRKIFSKYSILNSQQVISISNQTAQEVLNFSGRVSNVIYNPVSSSFPVPIDPPFPRILCASSLSPHKNIPSAAEAVSSFLDIHPRLRINFTFIGSWHPDSFPPIADDARISLLGYVSSCRKNILFSRSSAILIPSLYEGFGIPYVEALMLRKALICADIPIAREIAGSYPFYISRPFGSSSIVEAFCRAFRSDFKSDHSLIPDLHVFKPDYAANRYASLLFSETMY